MICLSLYREHMLMGVWEQQKIFYLQNCVTSYSFTNQDSQQTFFLKE